MTVQRAQRGQGMVEYTIILVFGVLMLMGPGGDVLSDLIAVFKNKYRGYSYSMSLTPMPDFGTGSEFRAYISDLNLDPELDDETIDRLTVDPLEERLAPLLEAAGTAQSGFNQMSSALNSFDDLDDLAADMLRDAVSPF
ncbi:MAG: hypothetical protein ACPHUF_15580 [Gammaproteobacteria bacterium]